MSAGKGWGGMAILRIGQEVVVTYLEGDPDRPLITGVVYNAEQMPAYTLPDEKSKSYIKTNSTKGGNGYNEIRLEDKHQHEQIFIHAQGNMDTRVLQNETTTVMSNQHLTVGYERDGKAGDQMEKIWRDKYLQVLRNCTESVDGNDWRVVGYGGASDGGNAYQMIEKGKFQEIGQAYHIHAGMTLSLEADTQISLKVGGNYIVISPAGVSIQGTLVLINTPGGPPSLAPPMPPQPPATDPSAADNSKTGQKSSKD